MAKEKKVQIGYRILKIHTTKFSFEEIEADVLTQLLEKNGLSINVNVNLNISDLDSTITIDVSTQLFKPEEETFLVEHSGRTVYLVQELGGTFNKEKNAYDLPNELLVQLYSIAYTHARALLATEISPTVYKDKYFLPIINPIDLLKTYSKKE